MAKKALKPVLKNSGTASNMKELKKGMKSRGAGGYLVGIPADGRTVRFLTEPIDWFKFFEHYDESLEDDRYFPCTEGDCRGCDEGLRASKRYLANALDTGENKVIPLKLPASLASDLTKRYDKFGTMTDRDYELSKEGTGLDTEYDTIWEDPKKMKLDRFTLLDLEAVLIGILTGVDEDDDEDDDEDEKPRKKTKPGGKPGSKSRKSEPDDDDDEDDDDDDEPAPKAKKRPVKKTAQKRPLKKKMGKK